MIAGGYFNVPITFSNVSMTIHTVLFSLWDYLAIDKAFIFKLLYRFCTVACV